MAEHREGYARLPEDLLRDLLAGADDVVDRVTEFLAPALEGRAEFRDAALEQGWIQTFEHVDPGTICGVDGGFAVERTASVDLLLSVGVGVEGLSEGTTPWQSTQYEWWTWTAKHAPDTERLARGVMVAQELAIVGDAPHDIRILDGSHLTLVIQLNSALTAFTRDLRAEARRTWERLETREQLHRVVRDARVLGMPKYDSSRVVTDAVGTVVGRDIPGDDKYLMGLILEPGELLTPQRVPAEPWASLHFNAPTPEEEAFAGPFLDAIGPLKERELLFTYFKPERFSPAFRIELKPDIGEAALNQACTTLSEQITGPFVREPYPQYLADVMAKSVGLGLSALQAAVQLALSETGREDLAELLIHSYRTEGV